MGDGSGTGETRDTGVGVGGEGVVVGDGLTVGVGVSGGGNTAIAGAVVGTEVGGRGSLVGGLPPVAMAGGPSDPKGSDSRKLTRLATPQLRRLNPRTMSSSTAQADLASDGRGIPRKEDGCRAVA